jgi:hypothetical protein
MNAEAAIFYLQQRMRELDKTPDQYHFEYIRVQPTPAQIAGGYFERNAYNEIWVLINQDKYYGVLILADNSAFLADDEEQSGKNELTGIIRFIKIAPVWNLLPESPSGSLTPAKSIPYEFVRVLIH